MRDFIISVLFTFLGICLVSYGVVINTLSYFLENINNVNSTNFIIIGTLLSMGCILDMISNGNKLVELKYEEENL